MGPRLAFVLHNGQILVVPGLRGHPGSSLMSLSSAGRGGICAGGRQRGGRRPRAGPGCTPVLSPAACAGGRTSTDAARPGDVSRPVPSREGVRRAASPARPAGEESTRPQGARRRGRWDIFTPSLPAAASPSGVGATVCFLLFRSCGFERKYSLRGLAVRVRICVRPASVPFWMPVAC